MSRRVVILVLICLLLLSRQGRGQLLAGGEPSLGYNQALNLYHEGSFPDALELFRESARMGVRTVDGRWYDSICYYAMIGECLYAMGNLPQALEQYNAALAILVANPRWMDRVQFPNAVRPQGMADRIAVPWGPADRKSMPGDFSIPMQVLVGRFDNSDIARRGGVVVPHEYQLLNVAEVVRCLAISMRRRIEILGPLAKHDAVTRELAAALEGNGGARNQWSRTWTDVQSGLVLAALGRDAEASAALERAAFIGGTYTHPSSGIALFELGRLLAAEQRYEQAESYFLKASVAAAEFGQFALVEESLAQGTAMHIFRNNAEPLAEIAVALDWSRRERIRHLTAALLVDMADNLFALGRTQEAGDLVGEARRARGRRTGISTQLSARLEAQTALVAYRNRQLNAANTALANAITAQKACSPWLYQINVADSLSMGRAGDTSNEVATALYADLLREPTSDDWIRRTLDTLAVQMNPHFGAYENWLTVCLARGDIDQAFLVSEILRRHRFHASLPMAGRLLSLRWILEAPVERLDREAMQRRTDLQTRMPDYVALSQRADELRRDLVKLSWVDDDSDEQKEINKRYVTVLTDLGKLAETQELMLGEVALLREVIPRVFPPLRTAESIQQSLAPRQAVLVFISVGNEYVAFLISKDELTHWQLPATKEWRPHLNQLLRAIGLVQSNGTLNEKTLDNGDWKAIAASLQEALVDRSHYSLWTRYDELTIVPDGVLWYLPFEILPAMPNESQLLASRVRINYLPTAGLLGTPAGPRTRSPTTTVVTGKLHAREDGNIGGDRLSELRAVVRNVNPLPGKLPIPTGLARCSWDRLVVLPRTDASAGTMAWSPINPDSGRSDSTIARWLQLPWGAPREIILPGFTSAAENGGRGGNGEEIAHTILGLMASGSRTVLLSRWRTGGQTSFDLLREFLQEIDQSTPSEAWHRSVNVARQQQVHALWEPRVSVSKNVETIPTEHPFFWAAFLLSDQGTQPAGATPDQEPVAEPALASQLPTNDG